MWLGQEDVRLQTYCMVCRDRLVGIHQRIIAVIPEGMIELQFLSPPVDVSCKCGTIYHIKNVI